MEKGHGRSACEKSRGVREERSAWTGGEDRRREERERGVDGARAGGLALTSLIGASTELDMYLQYYLY